MILLWSSSKDAKVVLLAEDVDCNAQGKVSQAQYDAVVLLAEDVDRNLKVVPVIRSVSGRPPRGGRG